MSDDLRHRLGRLGEDHAAAHLERRGLAIVARNHRTRFGELDLIAYGGDVLVFAEVKTRRAGSGTPWATLDERKRRQVRRMAHAWLHETSERPRAGSLRFDAIGVIIDPAGHLVCLDHLEGAF
ncbi:YraN family protein [Capillimicrobium parvum]|uniref:UPF0102 protein DSM104329_02253 n=1 Tax=Capillimicrobium parvum TaxID=2884022 RepID=A0A9E6XXZ1_9ACTN|nr:YraN family protein [Capillimicrobium parvum]UGS35856.1 hypothetical protein DSM104329_02253 [Capillimicrobium parvum]